MEVNTSQIKWLINEILAVKFCVKHQKNTQERSFLELENTTYCWDPGKIKIQLREEFIV